jgi:hypothetical protein
VPLPPVCRGVSRTRPDASVAPDLPEAVVPRYLARKVQRLVPLKVSDVIKLISREPVTQTVA